MQILIKTLVLVVILTSCGTGQNSRYRDTAMLERPPVLPVVKQPEEQSEAEEIDNSVIPEKQDTAGLGTDVYLTDTTPPRLKIKQPVDEAWETVGLALKQSDIKITDHEREKGFYYVSYHPKTFLEKAVSFLKDETAQQNDTTYLLTLEPDGPETTIIATVAGAAEQSAAIDNRDGDYDAPVEGAEALLQVLYETLRDDLEEK
jgi:uncharacterized lipoprotein